MPTEHRAMPRGTDAIGRRRCLRIHSRIRTGVARYSASSFGNVYSTVNAVLDANTNAPTRSVHTIISIRAGTSQRIEEFRLAGRSGRILGRLDRMVVCRAWYHAADALRSASVDGCRAERDRLHDPGERRGQRRPGAIAPSDPQ